MDLIENSLQTNPHLSYCIDENVPTMKEITYDENLTEKSECQWKQLKVDYQINSPLTAKIPIGNEKAFPPVLYATIILSWIVSLWTVFRTRAVPIRINDRLEQQRLQQKKTK